MKLVKIFAGLVILILILAFLTQNTNIVAVDLIFVEPKNVKVANVMLGAISVGILIGFVVALTNILSDKSEIRSLKIKNRKLSDELNDLRNVLLTKVFMTRKMEKINIDLDFPGCIRGYFSGCIYLLFPT